MNATHEGGSVSQMEDQTAPLLFLPSQAADVLVLIQYIKAGSFSILLWDVLNSLSDDFKVVFRRKFNFFTFVFILTRLTGTVVVLNSLLYTVGEVENCYIPFMVGNGLFTLNRACTTLLFYARVTAVYTRHRYIKRGFGALWILTAAASSVSLFDGTAYHLGPTRYCLVRFTKRYLLVIITAAEAVYDTIICGAITYQMHRDDVKNPKSGRWRWRLNRDRAQARIRRFSQIFVRDSQLYFLFYYYQHRCSEDISEHEAGPTRAPARASRIDTSRSNQPQLSTQHVKVPHDERVIAQ